jgi:hypothetical protein
VSSSGDFQLLCLTIFGVLISFAIIYFVLHVRQSKYVKKEELSLCLSTMLWEDLGGKWSKTPRIPNFITVCRKVVSVTFWPEEGKLGICLNVVTTRSVTVFVGIETQVVQLRASHLTDWAIVAHRRWNLGASLRTGE